MSAHQIFLAQTPAGAPAAPAPANTVNSTAPAQTQSGTVQTTAAPSGAPAQPQPGMLDGLMGMLPFILVIVVMFYLMSRSQKKEQKKRQEMLDALKKGDEVLTVGGMFGKISELKEDRIILEIAENVKITVARTAISAPRGAASAEVTKK